MSSCERGYIATWLIENDSLFFVGISSCGLMIDSCLGNETLLERMFSTELKNGRLYASWYSKKIIIPQGRLISLSINSTNFVALNLKSSHPNIYRHINPLLSFNRDKYMILLCGCKIDEHLFRLFRKI